jgi:hypothetical protein
VAPPSGLDYEFWLGPAPRTPHTQYRCSDESNLKTWWFISDYTLGFVSGWGVHPLDIALWGGGDLLGGTVEVEGRGTFRNTEGACNTATIWEVDYRFGSGVTLKFVGVPNGENAGKPTGDPFLHREEWKARYRRISDHGTAFEGSDGWAEVHRGGINLQPDNLIDNRQKISKHTLEMELFQTVQCPFCGSSIVIGIDTTISDISERS